MKAVVIGAGKMATDCIRLIKAAGVELPLTVTTLSANAFGTSVKNLPPETELVETRSLKDLRDKVCAAKPDVIFSINNFLIVPDSVFAIAPKGIINFHNAPLPRYGGLNACSWAIINGEKAHAVTWHYMSSMIDAGDLILQDHFPIDPTDTGIKLLMKCILRGTNLFGELLVKLQMNSLSRIPQDLTKRTYFGKKDLPNSGKADFTWPFQKLNDFIRGLNFNPVPNMFVYPEAILNGERFLIDRIERLPAQADVSPGRISEVSVDGICVQGVDSTIKLCEVRGSDAQTLSMKDFIQKYKIKINDVIL